jgi:hypothetical protein
VLFCPLTLGFPRLPTGGALPKKRRWAHWRQRRGTDFIKQILSISTLIQKF